MQRKWTSAYVGIFAATWELEWRCPHPLPEPAPHELQDLVVVALLRHVLANGGERLTQDGDKHVEEHEEDEENIQKAKHRPDHKVGFLQNLKLTLACLKQKKS